MDAWMRECTHIQHQYCKYAQCLKQCGTAVTNRTEGALTQLGSLCRLLRLLDVC